MEGINSSPEREIGSNKEEVKGRLQKKTRTRGYWTPVEDEKLKQLVEDYGAQNWNLHAQQLEGRSGKNCRLRWHNELDPRINKGAFTEIEEEILLAAHEIYGNKWSLIAKRLPGRTDNAVKNQWHVLMARKRKGEEAGIRKRKREVDGRYMRCPSHEMSIGCSSTGESGVTANTDISLGSIFSQGHGEMLITVGVRGDTSMSTGTEYRTSSNTMPQALASEFQRNHEERVVTVPFIDFIGIGSVEREVAVPSINFMGFGLVDREVVVPFIDFLGIGSI